MKLSYFLCALLVCFQQTYSMEETPENTQRQAELTKERGATITRAQIYLICGIVTGIGAAGTLIEAYKETKYTISVEESTDFSCEGGETYAHGFLRSEPVDKCSPGYGCKTKLKPAECKNEHGSLVKQCPKNSYEATMLIRQLRSEKIYHCVSRVGVNTVIAKPWTMTYVGRNGHKQPHR